MSLTPESLVNKSLELVSPPNTYLQLNALIQDPNSAIDDISAVINTDPALATRLLKIVNSPFYGFPSQINTISRAITIVGTRELTHLVLATSVLNSFKGIPASLINMDEFWQHCFACAITSKLLAEECGERATEHFFIAGLLHNIGSLVLYKSVPELAGEAIRSAEFGHEVIFKAEQRVLGFDHTEVGQALIKAWRLPPSLEEVARYHHSPSDAEHFPFDVAIVHIADILVSSVPFGHSGDQHVPPLDPAAWKLLGLDENQIPDLLQQVSQQINQLTSVMLSED
ncbi:HDOD domain-containing protein [Methylophaga sp.]|uniref:HDOD domain-containing protein n=1 Tax=Methylophaga sp. TaxID=2024840 RepID=UPI003F69C9F3